MRRLALLLTLACGIVIAVTAAAPAQATRPKGWPNACTWNAWQCTEVYNSIGPNGAYTGHDEPSLLFYSNRKGSGNSTLYRFVLPKDPATPPVQDGSGTTWNFELHPAFWFGMALCDNQSAPEYTTQCTPDSNTNIKDGADPSQSDFIGYHAGSAYMEMQFYPPGWAQWPPGVSCSRTQWCAALNIDSYSVNLNTNVPNNNACLHQAGVEPVAFAFITKNGVPQAPANPATVFSPPYSQITPDPTKDLMMNPGDVILLNMHDTGRGFEVMIHDLTTHQKGLMIAGASNGWSHVLYQPSSGTCHTAPYSFHPMYATSNEHTRVPWAAHSYNVAFSDEIGHFELCSNVDESSGFCNTPDEPLAPGFDDYGCFGPGDFNALAMIGGCLGTDTDFDGVPYQASSWPGNGNDANTPAPVTFTSPLIDGKFNYDRVAFETDLPRIEVPSLGGTCNRTTGAGCTNPPPGGAFYPIFTTATGSKQMSGCVWQLGGPSYPGTTNTFGGTSSAEYGSLLSSLYPGVGLTSNYRYNNFRQILPSNPCPTSG